MGAVADLTWASYTTEAKQYLWIDGTDWDTILERFWNAACRKADDYLCNPFEDIVPRVVLASVEAADTVTINDIIFTAATATDEDEREFKVGVDDDTDAMALAALVNSGIMGGSKGAVGVEGITATVTALTHVPVEYIGVATSSQDAFTPLGGGDIVFSSLKVYEDAGDGLGPTLLALGTNYTVDTDTGEITEVGVDGFTDDSHILVEYDYNADSGDGIVTFSKRYPNETAAVVTSSDSTRLKVTNVRTSSDVAHPVVLWLFQFMSWKFANRDGRKAERVAAMGGVEWGDAPDMTLLKLYRLSPGL